MSERAAALPVETTQAHGDSSTKCHSEISLVRLFCQSELALQKCLCTDPPALDGSKSRSDRSSWVRLQQLFPKRRTALCLDRPHRVFLSCSAHHKARGCDRQRSRPEPARPLRGHLSPRAAGPASTLVLPGRAAADPGAPRSGARTPSWVPAAAGRGEILEKKVGVRSKKESGPTCRESVGRLVPGLAEAGRPSRPRGTGGDRCLCGSCAQAAVFVLSAPHMV